jgi:putative membrane protein
MSFIVTIFASGGALIIADAMLASLTVSGFWAAIAAGLVLGILNALVRPVLMFLTFPINLLTLGLFTFVINALVLWLAASIVAGVTITGFWPAFFTALIVSLVTSLVDTVIED